MMDEALIPIRMFEALGFCPRQAWYRFVSNEDPVNVHMERGLQRHAVFDEAEREVGTVFRAVPVAAPSLGVAGMMDEVRIAEGELWITEVKAARLSRFVWSGIELQLAVQRLALAEQVARGAWYGPPLPSEDHWHLRAYFSTSRRYRDVPWTDELADRACAAIASASRILDLAAPPLGRVDRACYQCQVIDRCMPFESELLAEATS
jgi:CRISPR/Cas system-associated exonuclease Cas4 (RecB family)